MKGTIMSHRDKVIIALCFVLTWFFLAVMMGGLQKLENLIREVARHVAS